MPGPSRAARRRIVVAAILALGWGAAAAIYLAAPAPEDDPAVYELQHSREYERQVEVIGGKGALLATELDRWISGLFEGRSLAYTIAVLTAIVALAAWAWDRVREAPPDPGD